MSDPIHALPPSQVWLQPIAETSFVFLDLEMTGLDPKQDRVCEVCAIRTLGERVEHTLSTLVNPQVPVGASANIHGLSDELLSGAPRFEQIAEQLATLVEGAIVVGHGIVHDRQFLEHELARYSYSPQLAGWLDTLPMARRAIHLKSHQLRKLTAELGIEHVNPHRAHDDAHAVMGLFLKLKEMLGAQTPYDLWHVRIGEGHTRPEVLERARLALTKGTTVDVRYRPSRRSPERFRMKLTAIHDGFEPARLCGYEVESRGRIELRADRVLSLELIDDSTR
ncbi:MAG: 3'-5' exonuclease [Polyangiaceae bacterium]